MQDINKQTSAVKVQNYLKSISSPIYSIYLTELLLKSHSSEFNNCNYAMPLQANNHYQDLYSKSLYNMMVKMNRKNLTCFDKAYTFLKMTAFYKEKSSYLDMELTIFNKKEFTAKLGNLELLNKDGKNVKMSLVVRDFKSHIILIDFWATWCGPCINEYKSLQKLRIPPNVSILNLSVYKVNNFKNWKSKEILYNISILI